MILFFGPPGSGKSVQGQLLVERNNWEWLSTGELFRNSKDPEVLERMATGELIDDELTNKVLATALQAIDASTNAVLDGYPRNTDQAAWLLEQLPAYGRRIDCVVMFDVPHDELVKRLMGRGRTEDALEVIERRLAIYSEKTQPVIDFYEQHNVPAVTVDGTGDIQAIHERIQSVVMSCLQQK